MSDGELIDELLADAKERMAKSVEATRNEFATVRTGRASPAGVRYKPALRVLDRRNLALAQERLKARCGLRESNKSHRYSNGYDPHPNSWMGNGGQLW